MALWSLDYFILATALTLIHTNKRNAWMCFSSANVLLLVINAAIFYCVAAVGVVSTHTILVHVWHAQNVWFAALLILQCFMALVSSFGDALDTTNEWGVHQVSRVAGVMLSLRLGLLLPITVVVSLSSLILVWFL